MNEKDFHQIKSPNHKLIYESVRQDIMSLANIKNSFNNAIRKKNMVNPRLFLKDKTKYSKVNTMQNMAMNLLQSKNNVPPIEKLEKRIYKKFCKLYKGDEDFYNIKIINEIISNDNSHIVAEFKDFLIKDDYSEFIQKYYNKEEAISLLYQIFEYYK